MFKTDYDKHYREQNKEYISALQFQWYQNNKDKISQKNKEYRKHNDRFVMCDICCCKVKFLGYKQHLLTSKHKKRMSSQLK